MYIGIDIGGTSIRIASSNSLDTALIQDKVEFLNTGSYGVDYVSIVQAINNITDNVEDIGIGIPGTISKNGKTVISNNHNKEWVNKPFIDSLSAEFKCPVYVANDAVAAALGVAYYGEGKGLRFPYVTWGTGIGGANINIVNSAVEGVKFIWNEYFKSWEDKCGGKNIEAVYGKTGDKLSEQEWEKVMSDFYSELELFIKKI